MLDYLFHFYFSKLLDAIKVKNQIQPDSNAPEVKTIIYKVPDNGRSMNISKKLYNQC